MADLMLLDTRRCVYFFLYDGSKVRGEGDPTRQGICYFYPEETPLDKQDLLCGQLAGVARCVSELSSSPVRTLTLRRCKFAIHTKEDLFWALGCSMDVPTVSVCELLEHLINIFCFYNGSVRQSYQLNSKESLAARWARYLSHVQSGPSELCYFFRCLRTIDSTNVDPLLFLKAALILQACQRCPLVLVGCIFFRGRVVSTQMSPQLTMKVMVYESEIYTKSQKSKEASTSSPLGGAVSSTAVFLTASELQYLQSAPVNKDLGSQTAPHKKDPPKKTRLSRTLSDTPSSDSETPLQSPFRPHLSESHDSLFSPASSQSAESANPSPRSARTPLSNGRDSGEAEEEVQEGSYRGSFQNEEDEGSHGDSSVFTETHRVNGDGGAACGADGDHRGADSEKKLAGDPGVCCRKGLKAETRHPPPLTFDGLEESPLVPMTLYMYRVNGLVLALLVEPPFTSDTNSMKEVNQSSLASLNGLEAHLRAVAPVAPGALGQSMFAHYDCIQSTLKTNVSGRSVGGPEHLFVRATSLLHSHFCDTETLQEAIIRNGSIAVYGTRSVAQETYFLQHGGAQRNSGIPNQQDSAFSLPSKARHKLLKHGVNLL
ncbi:BLOC-3 complex member HPS4 [Austrofundulus limnaeus]|uniref:BLOC-3 complex member HPS4 n=1 Tax=Austrofundulus limnaeus TaxID=52670 RepID=A0A2I4BTE5_AUSLI|nr:PREDICTED: Hermansky-Pudlak syndrome 4 protein [Austrofundulus limnaeus]